MATASALELTARQRAEWNDTNSGAMVASLVTFLVLGNAACAIRLIAQYVNTRKALLEDLFIVTATACFNAVCACYLKAIHHGLGYHIWRVIKDDPDPPERLRHIFYWIWLPSVFNGPFFTAVKLCLLCLYYRLFMIHQRWFKIAWWTNLIYALLWFVGSTLFYILTCNPPSYYWNRAYAMEGIKPPHSIHGRCDRVPKSEDDLTLIFGLISDVGIFALPIIALAKLHVPRKKKIGLLLLFSLGLSAIILEIARIVFLETRTDLHGYGSDADITYDMNPFFILTCAVECIAIICASIPVIAPQAVKFYRITSAPVVSSIVSRYSSSKKRFTRTQVFVNPTSSNSDTTMIAPRPSDETEKPENVPLPQYNQPTDDFGGNNGLGVIVKRTDFDVSSEGQGQYRR